MRHIVYFSSTARTSGNFDSEDLMKSGRMDIVMHFIINSFFISHEVRDNVVLHLVFYGSPDPPKHIEIRMNNEMELNKKNIAKLIKKILYKYKKGEKIEVFPGCFIEKKSFLELMNEFILEKKEIFIFDKKGENIRKIKFGKDSVFVIGDQNGFPKKEIKRLKNFAEKISVGPKTYFASQVVTILNNELDLRNY